MGKIIKSPVERWPGTITLPDYLTYQQEASWEDVLEPVEVGTRYLDIAAKAGQAQAFIPVILAIVQEWKLEGFPEQPTIETFPATPKLSAALLLAWIIGEISAMHLEASEIPLELSPAPTPTQTVTETAAPDFQGS